MEPTAWMPHCPPPEFLQKKKKIKIKEMMVF
jgi:hypothetical protein